MMSLLVFAALLLLLHWSNTQSHNRSSTSDFVASLCPTLSTRMPRKGETTRSIFVGDSTALQALRVSVAATAMCLESAHLIDSSKHSAVLQATVLLKKRLIEAADVEKISIASEGGGIWEFWFVKAKYLDELHGVARSAAIADVHLLSRVDLLVAVGTWDISRPSLEHSGLVLDAASTKTSSSWKAALRNFTGTTRNHAAHITELLTLPVTLPRGAVRMVLPMAPNCSAHKFHRVLDRAPTNDLPDPYEHVQGRDCRRRLVDGTAPILREALLHAATVEGSPIQVIDYDDLLTTTQSSASSADVAKLAGVCTASDGAHFDDLSTTIPLLTPCTLRLLHLLWR
jgi:hypothetical protein